MQRAAYKQQNPFICGIFSWIYNDKTTKGRLMGKDIKTKKDTKTAADTTTGSVLHALPHISDHDVYFFKEGSHFRLYDKLGAHPREVDGAGGTHFALWAPNAARGPGGGG